MNKYYLHDGQNQLGPFLPEELKERNITLETFVWKEGMVDWVKAKEIAELSSMLTSTPPPFKAAAANSVLTSNVSQKVNPSGAFKTGNWIGRNPILFLLILAVVLFGSYLIYNSQQTRDHNIYPNVNSEKTPEELRRELQDKEKENPAVYITASITMRKNLIGERVFEGTLKNGASTATFKDITIEVGFLSKTKSLIGTKRYTIYEVLAPQQTINIKKIKDFVPGDTDAFTVEVVSAKANE